MTRWMGIVLFTIASFTAACGGSPDAPSSPGVAITGLQVQILNGNDGGHDYSVSYTVHNGGPSDATVIGIDAALSAKGAQVRTFTIGFRAGERCRCRSPSRPRRRRSRPQLAVPSPIR